MTHSEIVRMKEERHQRRLKQEELEKKIRWTPREKGRTSTGPRQEAK